VIVVVSLHIPSIEIVPATISSPIRISILGAVVIPTILISVNNDTREWRNDEGYGGTGRRWRRIRITVATAG
jgi:hypothetical protein